MIMIDLLENEILSCMKCKYIINKKSMISFKKVPDKYILNWHPKRYIKEKLNQSLMLNKITST